MRRLKFNALVNENTENGIKPWPITTGKNVITGVEIGDLRYGRNEFGGPNLVPDENH
jgi:hypothetical protein